MQYHAELHWSSRGVERIDKTGDKKITANRRRRTMRKIIIGLLGAATIAVLAMPAISTDAAARGWGHHYGRYGGWRGGWGWRGGYYPYAYYPYYTGYSCYRTVRVWGPYGWGWRRVWVCG